MKNVGYLAVASAALFLFFGYMASKQRFSSWISPGARVLLLGSSSAFGLQPHLSALCNEIGAEVLTRAKNGSTAIGWAGTVESEIAYARPNVVVVVLGGNDSATTYPPEKHAAAIQKFVDAAAAHGALLYWVLPFALPWPDNFSPLVRSAGVRVFETSQVGIPMSGDKIHATPAGYKLLAEKVFHDLTARSG